MTCQVGPANTIQILRTIQGGLVVILIETYVGSIQTTEKIKTQWDPMKVITEVDRGEMSDIINNGHQRTIAADQGREIQVSGKDIPALIREGKQRNIEANIHLHQCNLVTVELVHMI